MFSIWYWAVDSRDLPSKDAGEVGLGEEPTIWIAPGRPVAVQLHSPEASDHLCHPLSIFLPPPAPGILHPHRPAHQSSLKMELQPHRRKIPEERATEWEAGTSVF